MKEENKTKTRIKRIEKVYEKIFFTFHCEHLSDALKINSILIKTQVSTRFINYIPRINESFFIFFSARIWKPGGVYLYIIVYFAANEMENLGRGKKYRAYVARRGMIYKIEKQANKMNRSH